MRDKGFESPVLKMAMEDDGAYKDGDLDGGVDGDKVKDKIKALKG